MASRAASPTVAATGAAGNHAAATRTTVALGAAEIHRLGTAAKGHHQHNAVHLENLQQNKREANPRTIKSLKGLEPIFHFPHVLEPNRHWLCTNSGKSLRSVMDSKISQKQCQQ
jgi:hypothetical protein